MALGDWTGAVFPIFPTAHTVGTAHPYPHTYFPYLEEASAGDDAEDEGKRKGGKKAAVKVLTDEDSLYKNTDFGKVLGHSKNCYKPFKDSKNQEHSPYSHVHYADGKACYYTLKCSEFSADDTAFNATTFDDIEEVANTVDGNQVIRFTAGCVSCNQPSHLDEYAVELDDCDDDIGPTPFPIIRCAGCSPVFRTDPTPINRTTFGCIHHAVTKKGGAKSDD